MNDSPQVAVVCDSRKVREAFAGYLREAEYDVTTFEDDRAYWQQVTFETIPDLLVLEVSSSMTRRDELLPQKYHDVPEFPILALLSPVTDIDRSGYPDSLSWVTKPIRREEFLRHVQNKMAHESAQTGEASRDESAATSGSASGNATGAGHFSATDLTEVQTPSEEQADSTRSDRTHSDEEVVGAEVARLQAHIRQVEGKVDSLQESRGRDDSLADLQREMSEISEEVAALSDHVGTLYDRINVLEENFDEIQGAIQSLNAGLETLTDEQVALAEDVESVTREQAEVHSEVDDLLQWQRNVSTAFGSAFDEE
jgi:DNA-binding response OmpR family regulator/outer membrane murein-binding lipoprotein Lpp